MGRVKVLFLIILLMLVLSVSAQNTDVPTDKSFLNICPMANAPVIQQLNPPLGSAYFMTQYVTSDGDLAVMFFDVAMRQISYKEYEGDWCR